MTGSTSFTRWARAAAVVAAVAALAAWLVSAGGIFSPGRLHAGRDGGGEMGGVASHAELSRQCGACHDYQANFVAAHVRDWGATCRGCHEGTDRFTAFRHDTTDFRLVGAHVRTQCAACHTETRTFAAFTKAPSTCAGCHREEDAHRGRFGTDCGACHNPSRWDDAKFDHTFPLNHGGETSIACSTCHTEMPSFRTYTCYGCHEHAPARIREEHLDEGIRDFRNCTECHATGTKDEAEDRGRGREDLDRGRDRDGDDGDDGRGRGRGGRGRSD